MSFFKKLLGTHEKTPEQIEKERQKQEELRQVKEELAVKLGVNIIEKEDKKILQEKYIGTGFGKSSLFSLYKDSIVYFEKYVLRSNEKFLLSIIAEYDKSVDREMKGLLIATDQRLVFVSSRGRNRQFFYEEFDYRSMNGITQAKDGLFENELYIDLGISRKKFDNLMPFERLRDFINIVMNQIHMVRDTPRTTTVSFSTVTVSDKYAALEKIGKLKEQGILTEEEFEKEKKKILNQGWGEIIFKKVI